MSTELIGVPAALVEQKPVDTRPRMKVRAVVTVATPTYNGTVRHDYCAALTLAAIQCAQYGIILEPVFAPGMSLVEYARNFLVKKFLDRKIATHLMWIDDDLGFDPDAILRMFAADKDAIAGVYPTKSDKASIFPYTAFGPVDDKGVQLAEIVPGGFLMLKRHVVEKVVSECKEQHIIECDGEEHLCSRVFDLRLDGNKLIGEDYVFCERVRRAGFPIHVLTNINFIHYGTRGYAGNLAQQLAKEADYNKEHGTQLGQGCEVAHKANAEHAADIDKRVAEGTLKG